MAERLFARFNAMDADGLAELFAAEITHVAPGSRFGAQITGRAALVSYFRDKVFASFRKINFVIERSYFDSGAQVELAEWRGELSTRSGVDYANRGIFVLALAGDQIVEMREYFDTEASRSAMALDAERKGV